MQTYTLLFLIAGLYLVSGAGPIITSTPKSWVCGMFFAGKQGDPPKVKIYELLNVATDCSARLPVDYYRNFCSNITEVALTKLDYRGPSQMKNSKQTVGNDLCTPIKKDVPAPGLQLGFFFSYCQSPWIDTGLRKKERLCCQNTQQVACCTLRGNCKPGLV